MVQVNAVGRYAARDPRAAAPSRATRWAGLGDNTLLRDLWLGGVVVVVVVVVVVPFVVVMVSAMH